MSYNVGFETSHEYIQSIEPSQYYPPFVFKEADNSYYLRSKDQIDYLKNK